MRKSSSMKRSMGPGVANVFQICIAAPRTPATDLGVRIAQHCERGSATDAEGATTEIWDIEEGTRCLEQEVNSFRSDTRTGEISEIRE